jgi:hypothetical protein
MLVAVAVHQIIMMLVLLVVLVAAVQVRLHLAQRVLREQQTQAAVLELLVIQTKMELVAVAV